jgi:hypothetical protein
MTATRLCEAHSAKIAIDPINGSERLLGKILLAMIPALAPKPYDG